MPIAPVGSTNLAAIGVPNVVVQIVPPNPLLNGVPTNIIGVVGTGSWGAVDAPIVIGGLQQLIANFGQPQNALYDLGTQVYTAYLQGANRFACVRVTDGTDAVAGTLLKDSAAADALSLTAIYTGTVGNSLNAAFALGSNYTDAAPTYKLSVWLDGGVPEIFDNVGGTAGAFWVNLTNAINMGNNALRAPSQLVRALTTGAIASVAVTGAGSYATLPALSATLGSGATLNPHMKAVSASIPSGGAGTGYSIADAITLTGGTGTDPIITVDTVDAAGGVLTYHITTPGDYTVLAANPVMQGSVAPPGGSGAEFNVLWGLLSVTVAAGGTGYSSGSTLTVTGGNGSGATGTLTLASFSSANPPSLTDNPFTFSGGLDGNSGVTEADLIGSDVATPRTGMYALRNSQASIGIVADVTDPTKWAAQVAYGLSEGTYMLASFANGFENDIANAIDIKQDANIANYAFKLMLGDWCQLNDPFNNVVRFVSPLGYVAGVLATQLPDNSSLNKIIQGIVQTQKSLDQQTYSDAELAQLQGGGIDVITKPIPVSLFQYGARLGINTSGAANTIGDNYSRMIFFLAETLEQGLGQFIGQPQSVDVQNQARATIQGFLGNLQQLGIIGTLDGSPAYSVILNTSNNPPNQVALGIMVADVSVTLWSIIFQFVVNLQAGQSVQIQTLPPQLI